MYVLTPLALTAPLGAASVPVVQEQNTVCCERSGCCRVVSYRLQKLPVQNWVEKENSVVLLPLKHAVILKMITYRTLYIK